MKIEEMLKYMISLEQCTSTMDVAKSIRDYQPRLLKEGSPYSLVIAQSQSNARGRSNKKWYSPNEHGLYFTLVSEKEISIQNISGLSLAVGVSICNSLCLFGLEVQLKWPNDIVVKSSNGFKKLGGILIETSLAEQLVKEIYIGVGINISNIEFPQDIPGISLSQISEKEINKEQLMQGIFKNLIEDIKLFYQEGFVAFRQQWLENNIIIGSKLKLLVGKDEITCRAIDISQFGHLLVEDENGVQQISSAEVLEVFS